MNDYALYDVKATLLTPLHIGSGQDLLNEYDYAIHGGRTWRLNEDTLLAAQDVEDPALAAQLARTPPAQLLDPEDYDEGSRLFRYVIRGTPRSKGRGAQVNEQLKDAYDRPYLPGTSLKGALRTALAWVAWEQRGLKPNRTKLKRYRSFAAQNYEHDLFGRNPNHDLLRALHVSDSAPVDQGNLILVNARVLHRSGKPASPIEMEALKPDTVFALTLKVDSALFSHWAGRDRLRGGELLHHLAEVVQQHTAQRIETELGWFKGVKGAKAIFDFYRQLPRSGLPSNTCLLQVGWGTGWDDKTLGSHLRADEDFMEGILRPSRQGGYGIARGKRRRGDPFPKSRRVLVQVRRRRSDGHIVERPVSPLGWILLEMKEIKR